MVPTLRDLSQIVTVAIFFLASDLCDACDVVLTATSGVISSPDFPNPYGNDLTCVWDITVPGNHSIELFFHDFSLQPPGPDGECYDSVKIYDGTEDAGLLVSPFCGEGPGWPRFPTQFLSSTGRMRVVLETDMSNTDIGFNATYRTVAPRTDVVFGVDTINAIIIHFDRLRNTGVVSSPLRGATNPSALSYDPVEDTFYYTNVHPDPEMRYIGRAKQDGSEHGILIRDDLGEPRGIVAAYHTGLLYWTDAGRDEVSVAKLDGTNRRTIVSSTSGCTAPRGIALDGNQEYVYWTCSNVIERSRADGSDREIFVGSVRQPKAIAIDSNEGFLYFTDVGRGSVEKVSLEDGGNRETVLTSPTGFTSIHDFVLDRFAFFWSDPGRVFLTNREGTPRQWVIRRDPPDEIEGLVYFNSEDFDLEDLHQCRGINDDCSGICFPGRSNSMECDTVTSSLPPDTDPSTANIDAGTTISSTEPSSPTVVPLNLVAAIGIGVSILAVFVVAVIITCLCCRCCKSDDRRGRGEEAPPKSVEMGVYARNIGDIREEGSYAGYSQPISGVSHIHAGRITSDEVNAGNSQAISHTYAGRVTSEGANAGDSQPISHTYAGRITPKGANAGDSQPISHSHAGRMTSEGADVDSVQPNNPPYMGRIPSLPPRNEQEVHYMTVI